MATKKQSAVLELECDVEFKPAQNVSIKIDIRVAVPMSPTRFDLPDLLLSPI